MVKTALGKLIRIGKGHLTLQKKSNSKVRFSYRNIRLYVLDHKNAYRKHTDAFKMACYPRMLPNPWIAKKYSETVKYQ